MAPRFFFFPYLLWKDREKKGQRTGGLEDFINTAMKNRPVS